MSEELQTRKLTGYVRDLILDRLDKAGTAVQPGHPGMSDARAPTAHTHPVAQLDDATEDGRALLGATLAESQDTLGASTTSQLRLLTLHVTNLTHILRASRNV